MAPAGRPGGSKVDRTAAKCKLSGERAPGACMEVWFEHSALAGGDDWDQKIRREIHDCAPCMHCVRIFDAMGKSPGHASQRSARPRWLTALLLLVWISSTPLHAMAMATPVQSAGNGIARVQRVEPCPHHHARHSDNRSAGGHCCLTTSCDCLGGGVVLGSRNPGMPLLSTTVVVMAFELLAPPASFFADGLERPPKPISL